MAREPGIRVVEVPIDASSRLFLEVQDLDPADVAMLDVDHPVAGRSADLGSVLDGVKGFAKRLSDASADFTADKVTVEFGCEVGLETGGLVAIVGKASGKSSMKITLEWTHSKS